MGSNPAARIFNSKPRGGLRCGAFCIPHRSDVAYLETLQSGTAIIPRARSEFLAVATLVAIGIAACRQIAPSTVAAPPSTAIRFAKADSAVARSRIEMEHVRLARLVPGYGGRWIARDSTFHFWLVDVRDSAKLRSIVEPELRAKPYYKLSNGELMRFVFEQGQYDFRELLMWRQALFQVFTAVEGVQSLGISHQDNKVKIGIVSEAARHNTSRYAIERGIPTSAFLIELEAPISWPRALTHER